MKTDFLCNWCGSTEYVNPDNVPEKDFGLGVFGLVDLSNIDCAKCVSKPRQRCLRQLLNDTKTSEWKNYKALQLSYDMLITISDWFSSVEVSIFEEENSINIQNIDRPDSTYDIIVCVHVLEHVEDDSLAIQELIRILTPQGKLYLMVPQPSLFATTDDWGFPDESLHGHYRMYGRDFENKLNEEIKGQAQLKVCEKYDEFTGGKEFIYVVTKNELTSNLTSV